MTVGAVGSCGAEGPCKEQVLGLGRRLLGAPCFSVPWTEELGRSQWQPEPRAWRGMGATVGRMHKWLQNLSLRAQLGKGNSTG